ELLQQQMEEVRLAVLPCVERWAAADPQLDGTVKLRFGVTADGLEDVWIEDHQAVPAEMLDCFSDGVYGTDWAGITREPIEVSWPFHVTADPP
ncbi:MAG TPA: hypothetical protein PKA64_05050, partial [Myxococcota bacterium]|nr:hypothetical protein [Myxococcota bacterium]